MKPPVVNHSDLIDFWSGEPEKAHHLAAIGRARFDEIGHDTFRRLDGLARHVGFRDPWRVIEWGVGGGANVAALPASTYIGVDISAYSLDEAEKRLPIGTTWCRTLAEDPVRNTLAGCGHFPPPNVILSTSCFQHFPSRAYGQDVARVLHECAAPISIGIIQTRYTEDGGCPSDSGKEYARHWTRYTAWTIDAFWLFLREVGFEPISLDLDVDRKRAYYSFVKDGRPPRFAG